ncbi:MAG: hypothetical protein OXC46_00440, partial [Thaumarchaeota archaeon]|nr:hypothetical protein [Nitrososphaerota archaeon]
MFISPLVPQVIIKSCNGTRFHVKNQGMRTWFEYELDLMDEKGKGFDAISTEISVRCHKFTFLVFKKLEEETSSWLNEHSNSKYCADIMRIHDKSCKIKDEIQQKYNLDAKQTAEYEKYVPKIQLLFLFDHICVKSDDWFNATVGNVPRKIYDRVNAEELHEKIKFRFRWFKIMVCSMLGSEIQCYLPGMERAFFRDSGLVAIKTDFEQRITIPTFELKKWVQRVSNKSDSSGVSNPDYIPGMDVLAKHDLTRIGFFAQAFVTKKLYEGGKLKVLGVENEPIHRGTNPNGKEYDVDIWLECDGEKIPVQVGVRVGELAKNVSDATICPGEEIKPNPAITKFGGTDMNFGKEPDFQELCEKLDQTPLGGMVLWITSKELLPGSGLRPLKEWYSGMLN